MPALALAGLALAATAAAAQGFDEAVALHVAGRYAEALAAYRRVAQADVPPEERAAALNNACALGSELGEPQRAAEECATALRLRRELGDEAGVGETANNLGLALETLGRPAEAAPLYREALAIGRRLGDREAEAVGLGNLGALALGAGRYSDAMALYRAAAALAESAAGEEWAAEQRRAALVNQGVVLEKVGAHRDALRLYRQLLAGDGGDAGRWRAALLVNAGVILRNLDDPVSAAAAFGEAIAAYERSGDLAGLSNAWLNLALAQHLDLGRPRAAERSYREALALAERAGDRGEEVQALFYLGRLLLAQGRLDEAEALFRRCAAVARAGGSAEGVWSALEGLGRIAAARGDLERSVELLEAALADVERVREGVRQPEWRAGYFGDHRAAYGALVAVLARLAAREPAAGHAGRAFGVVQRAKARDLLDALGEAAGGAAAGRPLASGEVRARLAGDVVLEYFVAEGEVWLFTVTRDAVALRGVGAEEPLAARLREVQAALSAGAEPPRGELAALAAALLPAAVPLPAAGGTLHVAPDGLLHYLPFEALPLRRGSAAAAGEPARLLLDLATVVYAPSASAALAALPGAAGAPSRQRPQLVSLAATGAVAAAAAGTSLPPLPAAEREVRAIAAHLGGVQRLYAGDAATEAAFRAAMAERPRVLHLAAHAVVAEPPGGGAAVHLAPSGDDDGRLTPAEIAAAPGGADLVVLAACRTALPGPGAEARVLASFTGAFLAAGSPAVVATLWDVDDAATAVFMDQLYGELARGRRPAEALRRAKSRLREDPRWDRPALWSAYVLVGDGPPVAPPRWRSWAAAAGLAAVALALLYAVTRR